MLYFKPFQIIPIMDGVGTFNAIMSRFNDILSRFLVWLDNKFQIITEFGTLDYELALDFTFPSNTPNYLMSELLSK